MKSNLHVDVSTKAIWCAILGGAGLLLGSPAHAQSAGANAAAAEENTAGQIEQIIVTARRQSEKLQQTPLAITALSSDALRQHDVIALSSLSDLVPGLDVAVTAGSTTAANIYIRGIGTYDYQIYTDPPTTIYIDGVLNARPGAALFDMIDMERVEVLRGPQGTLFGRNTTGGAISITTRKPSANFGIQQRLSYATDDEIIAQTVLDTGEWGSSGLSARFAYAHHQRNGDVRNLNRGGNRNPGWMNSDAIWAALHGDLSPTFRFDLRLDYTDHKAQQPLFQMVGATPDVLKYFGNSPSFGGDPLNFGGGRVKRAYAGTQAPDHSKFFGTSLTLEYDLSDAVSLKNITGYRKNKIKEHSNIAGQGLLRGPVLDPVSGDISVQNITPYILPFNDTHDNQFTNELQLIGKSGELSYVLGLFYLRSKGALTNPNLFTFVLEGGELGINQNLTRRMTLTTKSYAAYGQLSWRPESFDSRLELTGGFRFTRDKKIADENTTFNGFPSNVRQVSNSWKNWSGLGSISYQWTPDVMTYLRVSNAYRAGGFVPNTVDAYDPEHALSYEVGLKSELFDRRLQLNIAAFRTIYSDLQIQNVIQGLPIITNAGKAVFTGGEIELTALPLPNLQIRANLGYVDPEYKKYLYVDPVTGEETDVSDVARFNGVSKVNASIGGLYTIPLRNEAALKLGVDYAYRSRKVWFPLDNLSPFNDAVASNAHGTLNARLTLDDVKVGGAALSVELWGENLTNKLVRSGGLDFGTLGFGTVVYERGRRLGINFRAQY